MKLVVCLSQLISVDYSRIELLKIAVTGGAITEDRSLSIQACSSSGPLALLDFTLDKFSSTCSTEMMKFDGMISWIKEYLLLSQSDGMSKKNC